MEAGGPRPAKPRGVDLLERDGELARADGLIADAVEGNGGALALLGEPGIGKSALLDAVRERSAEAGMRTLTARGSELEREFPFGIARQLLEAELVRIDPARRGELLEGAAAPAERIILGPPHDVEAELRDGRHSPLAAAHALHWLVANLAELGPLAVLVDDLHWADEPSHGFLAYLAGRVDDLPCLLAFSARPREPAGETPKPADALTAEDACETVRLRPLTVAGVSGLLGEGTEQAFAQACHEATGGNPLLVGELRAELGADGVRPTAEAIGRLSQLVPGTVARSVLARLARMPPEAADLARSAAVLGDGSTPDAVARLAGVATDTAGEQLARLEEASILGGGDGSGVAFIHPLVRSAVYDDLGPGRRADLHSRAARVLTERGAPAEVVASHLLEAPPVGDPDAVEALRRAANDARARGAPELGARLLRRAREEPPVEELRGTVLAELGELEAAAGLTGAVEHLDEALGLPSSPEATATAALTLATMLLAPDRPGEAIEVCDRALARIPTSQRELRLRLEAEALASARMDLDLVDTVRERLAALPVEARNGRTPAERALCGVLTLHEIVSGAATSEETVELAERAYGDGRLIAEHDPASVIVVMAVQGFAMGDRFDLAARGHRAHLEAAIRSGSAAAMQMASGHGALMHSRAGDLRSAEADARVAWNDAGQLGELPGFPSALAYLVEALIETGRISEAAETLAPLPPAETLPNLALSVYPLRARGLLHAARGEWARSRDEFLEIGHRMEPAGDVNPAVTHWRTHAAIALSALGEGERAAELAEREVSLARQLGPPSSLGIALRGMAHAAEGEEQITRLEESERALAGSGVRLEHARSLIELGAALRRAGRRRASREPLTEGMRLARSCGAGPLAGHAHDELSAAGARPRRIIRTGVEELTASERRIADMAAEGMTNKQIAQALFVTVRTVENHLRHVFQKLEIGSRQELPDILSAR